MKIFLLVLALATSAPAGQLSQGFPPVITRVLNLNFNEGTGTTSKNFNGTTVTGINAWVSSNWGTAIYNNGTNLSINVPGTVNNSDGFWVHTWVKVPPTTAYAVFIKAWNGSDAYYTTFEINTLATGQFGVEERYGGAWGARYAVFGPRIDDNKWHMLDAVKGATTSMFWDIYVDGVYYGRSDTGAGTPYTYTSFFLLSRQINAVVGAMDDVGIYYIPAPNREVGAYIKRMFTEALGRHSNVR